MKINEAVGAFVKRFRAENGLTLEEIADAARGLSGVTWTAATISAIEHGGSKADSLPTMLILAAALSFAYKQKHGLDDGSHEVGVLDLLQDTNELQITGTLTVRTSAIIDSLTGKNLEPFISARKMDEMEERKVRSAYVSARRRVDAGLITVGEAYKRIKAVCGADEAKRFSRWELTPTAAERRAAKKLQVEPIRVAEASYLKFGYTLDEEVRRLAGPNASPQKRGRITRKVVEQLDEYMQTDVHFLPILENAVIFPKSAGTFWNGVRAGMPVINEVTGKEYHADTATADTDGESTGKDSED